MNTATPRTAESAGTAPEKGMLSSIYEGSARGVLLATPIAREFILAKESIKAGAGFVRDIQSFGLQFSADPSEKIFEDLAKRKEFKTPEGMAQLEAMRGDKQFTSALNAAIKKDPSVAPGLLGKPSENGNKFNMGDVGKALQDPQTRSTFTQMLNKIAEHPTDEFNFSYVTDVATAVQTGDYKGAQKLLAKANISDPNLELGATMQGGNPMAMLSMLSDDKKVDSVINKFIKDPNGIFGKMDPQTQEMFAGIFKFFAQFAKGFLPGGSFGSPYYEMADLIKGAAQEKGANVLASGSGNNALSGGAGNDTIGGNGDVKSSVRPTNDFARAANDDIRSDNDNAGPSVGPTAAEISEMRRNQALANAGGMNYGM